MHFAPGRGLLIALLIGWAITLALLVFGGDVQFASYFALTWCGALAAATLMDYIHTRTAWREANVRLLRTLPAAFALGVATRIGVEIHTSGRRNWKLTLFDRADGSLTLQQMPRELELRGDTALELEYLATPTRRGDLQFDTADAHVRSQFGLLILITHLGESQSRRSFPDFAQIARYAWLASDRRLAEIGIKTYQQRGEGTDFKQLAEYRTGDSLRHIDWKATLRHHKPIVRQFQNERDQCVLLLLDCGRRMRADDRHEGVGTSHFDQALNATMLLSYVALKDGDAVGAMTFGTPADESRWITPRKGVATLNSIMGQLYSAQPSASHSDYLTAAQDLLRRHRKRSLVIVITNFRDEDSAELGLALRLLRTRHLVLTASLRERIVNQLITSNTDTFESALDVASAHLFEQSRRDAFARIAASDSLIVDAEPQRLGIELVNRYRAVKNAGLI